jgi:hypothetical protein
MAPYWDDYKLKMVTEYISRFIDTTGINSYSIIYN